MTTLAPLPTRVVFVVGVALLASIGSPAVAEPPVPSAPGSSPSDDAGLASEPSSRQLPPPIVPPKAPPPPDDGPPVHRGNDPPEIGDRYNTPRETGLRADTPEPQRVPAAWPARLDEIDGLLRAERWRKARQKAESLIAEVLDRESSSRRSTRKKLGRLVTQLAIADAQQGLWKRAAWRWSTALMIDPSIGERPLKGFSDAGQWLSSLGGPRQPGEIPAQVVALRRPWPDDLDPARLQPTARAPRSLLDHPEWREHPMHTVEIVIDRWGQLSHPIVLDADRAHPAMIWVVLDAIWHRRPAAPATRGDQRVGVVQEFLVEELFPGLAARGRW